jgi:hypothetical protein
MANKKLAPHETNVNTIISRLVWEELGMAAKKEGDTKRNLLEKAIKEYVLNHHEEIPFLAMLENNDHLVEEGK